MGDAGRASLFFFVYEFVRKAAGEKAIFAEKMQETAGRVRKIGLPVEDVEKPVDN